MDGTTARSEGHGLLVELVQVFIVYPNILQLIYFGLLDILDLVSLHINFLSDLSTFFQVVESILLLNIFVCRNLTSDLSSVFDESMFSVFLDLPFLQLDLLLLLDLVHVVFSLYTCLFGKGGGLFRELLLSSLFEVSLDSLPLGLFKLFSFSGLSLALFEGSLGSQSINLSLSVSGLFLEFSQTLDLPLFFFSYSLGLLLFLIFSLVLFTLMHSNSIILVLLLCGTFLFLKESLSIGFSRLLHQ